MRNILQKFKKFGLQYCDLETMIGNLDAPLIFSVAALFLMANYFYTFMFSVVCQVLTKKLEDAVSTIIVTSLTFSSIIIIVKIFFMYLNHGTVQEIVSEYLTCDWNVNKKSRFGKNLTASLRIVKKRALIFWSVLVFNTVMYMIIPFFKKGRRFPNDRLILFGLDPMTESPNYEIAMTLTVCTMTFIGYVPAHVSSFFIIICGYTEAYILTLSKEIDALYNDTLEYCEWSQAKSSKANKQSFSKEKKRCHREKMAKFVEYRLVCIANGHITILNLANKVQQVYQKSLAAELILLMISLIIDLLGGLENTGLQANYSLLLVGVDCLAGQRVMDASVTFEKTVYACGWENFDPQNRKTVLLMLMNSQKTLHLSAGTVTTLDIETFGKIIKTIYSAYTALRSTLHKT